MFPEYRKWLLDNLVMIRVQWSKTALTILKNKSRMEQKQNKTWHNGHNKEFLDIRLLRVFIEHLVKTEYDIFFPLILIQEFANTLEAEALKCHTTPTRSHGKWW